MTNILTTTKKSKLPEVHPGDVVRIHQKITEGAKERIQVFEGIVIKTHGKVGPSATFTVRKISSGIGVEKVYPLNSPNIVKIEFKKSSKVRRAKLYYLRNLSGKALRMKEKKVDKDVWELIAPQEQSQEATKEEIKEAVVAAAVEEKKEEEKLEDAQTTPSQAEDKSQKDDTVKGEEKKSGKSQEETKS